MLVKNILIGEDIRQEIGNKLSMMGIFGGSLNVNIPEDAPKELPVVVVLAFLICIENSDMKDLKDFFVQVSLTMGENCFANINAKMETTGVERIMYLPIPRIEIPVTENSVLTVQAQLSKNDTLMSENSTKLDIMLHRTS